jgi:hypothetical protein
LENLKVLVFSISLLEYVEVFCSSSISLLENGKVFSACAFLGVELFANCSEIGSNSSRTVRRSGRTVREQFGGRTVREQFANSSGVELFGVNNRIMGQECRARKHIQWEREARDVTEPRGENEAREARKAREVV